MGSEAHVRRASLADLEALAELFDGYRQFYRQSPDIEGARAFLAERLERDQSVIFLASRGGEALGFTQLYPSFTSTGMARIFILNDLYVRPEARGQGVATALLRHAAQAVYEREGWQRDEAFCTYQMPLA